MANPSAHGGTPVPPPDPLAEATLFDIELPPPVSLSDKFGVPPFSVLDRRSGPWQDRKRRWLQLGMKSEVGRNETLTYAKGGGTDPVSMKLAEMNGGTSIFDPVVCELAYRWFSSPGDRVLDPFAGGSVRGITASILERRYLGVDIRREQVTANREQLGIAGPTRPAWVEGDATRLWETVTADDNFDLVFTCPPYGDLEVYSDHPRDISTWTYDEFLEGQRSAIGAAVDRLRDDRFACWVTSDIRDGRSGAYRGLVHETVRQFRAAGLTYWNDIVLIDPVGTSAIRAERPMRATRKITRCHQHLLVFCKGDAKRAAARLDPVEVSEDSSSEGLVS